MKCKTQLKQLNTMAFPILLNYLLMSIFEILDKAIVGHASVNGFGIIGIAAGPIFEITGALGILSVAFSILAAKQRGQGDADAFEQTFTVSRELSIFIGLGFFLLSLAGGRTFFRVVYGLTGEALEEGLRYFYPASFTVLQNMLIFQYSAYYRNRLNTKPSFYATALSTLVNLFFDLTLVHGLWGFPRLGTAGAAWGSIIGLGAGLLLYQIPYFRQHRPRPARRKEIVKALFQLYPPLLGQEFLESTLFVLVISSVVARMGTEQMAVYSLLATLSGTLGLPIYAYATATQTYVCQSFAAGDLHKSRQYLRIGLGMGLTVIGGLCLLCFLFQRMIMGWIVSDETVIASAGTLLGWVFLSLLAKLPYPFYMGCLQGTGDEKFVFQSAAIAACLSSVSAAILGPLLGLAGLYLVMTMQSLILATVYRKKVSKW